MSTRPVADVFGEALQRLHNAPGAAEHRLAAEQRRRALEAQRRAAAMEEQLRARCLPRDASLRAVIRAERLRATAPALDVTAALAWRQERRLPTGETPGMLLVLEGPRGCGKTAPASWFVARWPRPALFLTAQTFGAVPDSDWSAHVDSRARWEQVDLLVLDDLGMERDSGRVAARSGPLLLSRYNEGLATIITTNLSAERFVAQYLATDDGSGPSSRALSDRLRETQQRRGCPYWRRYPADAASLRSADGEATLARLDTIDETCIALR